MTENRDMQRPVYVQKADMALADIVAGGKLVADQRKRFILVNIKGQVMMQRCRVTTMKRETEEIPKMTTFGSRVWHPGTESQALTLAQRVKPGFDKVELVSREIVAQVDYPRFVLMDTVEGPALHNTMIGYLGLHTKRDLEELICGGDTTSTDVFLAMFDGIVAGATTNTYAAGAVALSSTVLHNTRSTMPSEYRVQPNAQYYTNEVAHDAYWAEVEARATNAGDTHLLNAPGLRFRNKDIIEVPLFPNGLGAGLNETAVMYMDAKQFIFAFHEDVELQSEYNIRERVWTIVVTARVAEGYEHEPAVVKTTGVLGQ
jgi:HK97 family phage major capsid protein